MNYKKLSRIELIFWILNSATALLRLIVIGRIGLTGDEAHYWAYFQHPSFSYFDHPPAVSYLIGFFTSVFGNSEFAVRLPSVLIFFVTSALVFYFSKKLFDEKTAIWNAVFLNVIPVFSFLGSVITIPDAPLSALWMCGMIVFWKLTESGDRKLWYTFGIIAGAALLCKYSAILLIGSAWLFVLASKEHRHYLLEKEIYLSSLISLLIFSPVLLWNYENNWASFGFQLKHGFGKALPKFSFELLGKSLGAQAGYISPLIFLLFLFILFWVIFKWVQNKDKRLLLIASFSFPTLLLFNFVGSFNEILPHWPVMGYLTLLVVSGYFTAWFFHKTLFKVFVYAACFLGLTLTVLVPLQAVFKIIPPEILLPKAEAAKVEDGITKAEKIDITNELYGWRDVGKRIAEIISKSPEPKPFIFTHRHYIASQLSFYIPGHPKVYCLSDRVDAYDFWQRDLSPLDSRNGLFMTNDYFYTDPAKTYPFGKWLPPETMDIFRNGRKIRIIWLTEGLKFNLKKLPFEYTSALAGNTKGLKDAVISADHRLFWLINKKIRFKVLDYCISAITKAEDTLRVNLSLIAIAVVSGFILWFKDRKNFWRDMLLLIVIMWAGGLFVQWIKDFTGRVRPLGLYPLDVNVFYERLERGSFPSGHTQIAFAAATFLTLKVKKYWWLFFLLAVFMGYTRVYAGSHFPTDVVGGAIIGVLTALIGIWLVKER